MIATLSPAVYVLTLGLSFAGLALVVNHCYARLALVELALNEGLPPGHDPARDRPQARVTVDVAASLGVGVHVFLSRSCHACQRLLDELDETAVDRDTGMHLRYVDRPRPLAKSAAERQGATLHEHDHELAAGVGADPLPYTVAVGEHGLIGRAVTPTVAAVVQTARDAGLRSAIATDPASGRASQ